MKIKKLYSYSNKKQIWRLLPTQSGKLIIEERDSDSKEAFFTCLDIKTGKKIFNDFQLGEKFWVGIEEVYKDIIYFHKFRKPDMPGHLGIIAFDIKTKSILWKNEEYIFLFIYNDEVYCFKDKFDGRKFYKLNYLTGKLVADLGEDVSELNSLREKKLSDDNLNYHFTKQFNPDSEDEETVRNHLTNIRSENLVSGKIDYVSRSGILFYSFHEILQSGGEMKNIFRAVDIESGNIIFEEKLNSGIKIFVPDSFFIIDDLLFLLKEKNGFITCSINK